MQQLREQVPVTGQPVTGQPVTITECQLAATMLYLFALFFASYLVLVAWLGTGP